MMCNFQMCVSTMANNTVRDRSGMMAVIISVPVMMLMAESTDV